MFKHIFLVRAGIVLLLCLPQGALLACATCGCMNPYLGVLPYDRVHRFETWYRYNSQFDPVGGSFYAYNTVELRGTFFLTPRLTLFAVLPYTNAYHVTDSSAVRKQGLNDATLLLQYFPVWKEGKNLSYRIGVRGGIKLPTSPFYPDDADNEFALGAGTVNYLGGLVGLVRFKKWVATSTATYLVNTKNRGDYQLGNGFIGTASVGYQFSHPMGESRLILQPSIGIVSEAAFNDRFRGDKLEDSAGIAQYAAYGVDVFYNNWSLSAQVHLPYNYGLNDLNRVGPRVLVGVGFAFNGGKPVPKAAA